MGLSYCNETCQTQFKGVNIIIPASSIKSTNIKVGVVYTWKAQWIHICVCACPLIIVFFPANWMELCSPTSLCLLILQVSMIVAHTFAPNFLILFLLLLSEHICETKENICWVKDVALYSGTYRTPPSVWRRDFFPWVLTTGKQTLG